MNIADVKYSGRIKTLKAQVLSLQDKLSNQRTAVDAEKVHLQAKLSTQTSQLKRLLARESREAEHVASVVNAVQALDPIPQVAFLRPKKTQTPMTAVLHLTDWHIGTSISETETEGWGGFNWEKAQDRVLQQLLVRFKSWLDTQRHGYVINDVQIVGTGDWVSGDIHDELRVYNEFELPVQTAKAGDLLGHVGRELAALCETLHVTLIGADNHGRLVRKPQAKGKALNSMSYLVHHIARKEWEKLSNVKVQAAESMKLLFNIGDFPFLGEHGDTVKSWMGVPWYGIEREAAREATNRMFNDRGFKFLIMGHWHKRFFGDIIVGGSLSGTDEYDRSCGRVSPPTQTAFLVGKRGPFNFVPFELR